MNFTGMRIALVGPLAPPEGGMAGQTKQLAELLRAAGAYVELVQVNPPYPAPFAQVRGVRALLRLFPYLLRLWEAAGAADLVHIMANSGWSWHLFAVPAIWIARARGKTVVVNYRGGEAAQFLARYRRLIAFSLRRADAVLVPSPFLARVFGASALRTTIVPNLIDLQRFAPVADAVRLAGPVLLVARNLEPVYDIASALRAFAIVKVAFPTAQLRVAGVGPQRATLEALAAALGVTDAVQFVGRIENEAMPRQFHEADIVINPSLADNMPISVLEALACGVPVVSTNVGGVPDLLTDGVTGLLVPAGDYVALADATISLLRDRPRAARMRAAGLALARRYCWERLGPQLAFQYQRALRRRRPSGYTAIISAMLFPLQEWHKRHRSVALRTELETSQWWSVKQLRMLQLDRLRTLLIHAGQHVPYYRALFERIDFDPRKILHLADLARLPILRKADISAQCDAFRADHAASLARFTTGGSSGEPLVFYIGKERVSHDVAAKWRATRWWGVDIGDPELVVWGSPIELKAQDWVRAARDRLLRTSLLPAFDLSSAKLDAYIARIRQARPAMLFGYPSALCLIARHALARRAMLDVLGIEVVFVTSERLYPEQREQIEQAFGCPVANGYGGRDAGFIAHECPEGGMHITAEDVVVEIVDPHGHSVPDGLSGEIVVTHLATGDFPFVRYGTGDIGTLGTAACACGRGLPLLTQIEGRSTDFVHAQDGTVMHGLALIYILRELPQVRAFKIIQESRTQTRVLVVALPALGVPVRLYIEACIKDRLGQGVVVVIDEVATIAPEASGKFRYVVSHVESA